MDLYQVDAFASKPFEGNPAAICFLDEPASDTLLQQIAKEMNLSETAFLSKREDGYNLRWFTPAYEVDLCGHATLASAHILWETERLDSNETARFHSRSGLLEARQIEGGIEMNFPAQPAVSTDVPPALITSLGVTPIFTGYNGSDYLVVVQEASVVKSLQPDFRQMYAVPMRGVIVTAKSDDPGVDFISRFFAPAAGIDEDPVTGSAHCCLGPYWARRLGTPSMNAFQASSRGGRLLVRVDEDRVYLTGSAVTVLEGKLKL